MSAPYSSRESRPGRSTTVKGRPWRAAASSDAGDVEFEAAVGLEVGAGMGPRGGALGRVVLDLGDRLEQPERICECPREPGVADGHGTRLGLVALEQDRGRVASEDNGTASRRWSGAWTVSSRQRPPALVMRN